MSDNVTFFQTQFEVQHFITLHVSRLPILSVHFAHPSQRCTSDVYLSFRNVAIVLAVLFPLGIPLFFFYRLFTHRKRLHTASVRFQTNPAMLLPLDLWALYSLVGSQNVLSI
jgi:hypothetical protein